jgi:hypothetical protein
MSKLKSLIHHIRINYLERIRHDFRLLIKPSSGPQVNFLVCGTQKGGTTTLDAYLRNHPEVCMATHKEVHFFDREKYFLYQKPDYSHYAAYFKPDPGQKILGETTPVYMYWYSAPRRIWEYNAEMKLIMLLRNPIERAYSHWNMQRERGFDPLPFLDAIQEEENRLRESLPLQNRRHSYLDRGFYTEQIKRFQAFFPNEQMLILKSKSLREEPQLVLTKVCQFIGVSQMENVEILDHHAGLYVSAISPKEHEHLKNTYELEIKNIEKITGWNCQDWLERN